MAMTKSKIIRLQLRDIKEIIADLKMLAQYEAGCSQLPFQITAKDTRAWNLAEELQAKLKGKPHEKIL